MVISLQASSPITPREITDEEPGASAVPKHFTTCYIMPNTQFPQKFSDDFPHGGHSTKVMIPV
jgi:hypothetical protein